jgi:NAD(P)-dependent dehydrogenase (short-subunit alcohol dehydrogenase family)
MTSDPGDAQVLVTDGGSALGQALVRALAAAGAARIWVGLGKHLAPVDVPAGLRGIPQITCLRLDVTDGSCVGEAAATIGGELDILINTTDVSSARAATEGSLDPARAEMEAHYFGLLNLARYFVPCLTTRAAGTQRLSPAWVNILSLAALSNSPLYPHQQTLGAAMAAAHVFSQAMRAQLRQEGARLITVFPGPLDTESHQRLQQPKLALPVLAQSILAALRSAVEEVYPGEVAREWLEEQLAKAHGT